MSTASSVYLLGVLGRVQVLDRDITAVLSTVTVVASKAVQGFLGTQAQQEITGEGAQLPPGSSVFPQSLPQPVSLPISKHVPAPPPPQTPLLVLLSSLCMGPEHPLNPKDVLNPS